MPIRFFALYQAHFTNVDTEAEGAKQLQEAEFKLQSLDISESSCHFVWCLPKGLMLHV